MAMIKNEGDVKVQLSWGSYSYEIEPGGVLNMDDASAQKALLARNPKCHIMNNEIVETVAEQEESAPQESAGEIEDVVIGESHESVDGSVDEEMALPTSSAKKKKNKYR